jgi:hypothetical protein
MWPQPPQGCGIPLPAATTSCSLNNHLGSDRQCYHSRHSKPGKATPDHRASGSREGPADWPGEKEAFRGQVTKIGQTAERNPKKKWEEGSFVSGQAPSPVQICWPPILSAQDLGASLGQWGTHVDPSLQARPSQALGCSPCCGRRPPSLAVSRCPPSGPS